MTTSTGQPIPVKIVTCDRDLDESPHCMFNLNALFVAANAPTKAQAQPIFKLPLFSYCSARISAAVRVTTVK